MGPHRRAAGGRQPAGRMSHTQRERATAARRSLLAVAEPLRGVLRRHHLAVRVELHPAVVGARAREDDLALAGAGVLPGADDLPADLVPDLLVLGELAVLLLLRDRRRRLLLRVAV